MSGPTIELAAELAAIPSAPGWNRGDAYSHRTYTIKSDLRDRILAALRTPPPVSDGWQEALREKDRAAEYLIDRLQACLRGERVRDLDEAMSANHTARAAIRALGGG